MFNRDGQDMQDKKRQLHHEEHEGNEVKPGTPLSATALCLSPLATNPATAGPLDHARRAAGGD
jgi:hypothetical protein